VRDQSVVPGLAAVAPGLTDQLAPLADDLWRGVDAVHHGARPIFAALRAQPRARAVCDAVDAHHDALLDRIDATAGPRWMPAARQRPTDHRVE
jgi:hypothetical protein